ncbi:sister chromatid cohesion protein DCC1-like [Biomphalaria glabrata]|uniref:Sister chromatid cohesion protein DCC1 n=1 Tax=Biomphalaria glabrata TaxID=6526 RepID=A0A9W3AIZ7_BIOGL|nr:sister chromatid cohesion protein DCC1-like [Biomphalaria glabrata]KAI8749998.1 sister chromatid cohesion protein DCC1-like; partial [Biomphalaria glabrata]
MASEKRNGYKNRTLPDIQCVLELAKLESKDLKPCVQCLFFSGQLENDSFKLLELDEPVLQALQSGKKVEIRGDPSENAVLVTDSATYELKEAETSNSMLMLPKLTFGPDLHGDGNTEIINREVTAVVHNYYELRPIKPKLKKLRALLMENPYRGKECEGDEQDTYQNHTFAELQSTVQASDQEIKAGLAKINACEIQGFWRLLDLEYSATVLYHIVQLCEERNWFIEGLNMEECCEVLSELFPREVVEHMVRSHSKHDDSCMETDNSSNIFYLSEDKICKHFAEMCLRHSGKFNLSDFLKAWQESVPHDMKTSFSQIQGMALIDRDSNPEVIWYYNVDDLPEDINERFEVLFDEKKRWSLEEITPYVRDLTDDKTDVGALLTKFARASTQNGIKMFSSRKTS